MMESIDGDQREALPMVILANVQFFLGSDLQASIIYFAVPSWSSTKIYASKCLNLQVIKLLLFDNITIFEQLLGIWHVAKIL